MIIVYNIPGAVIVLISIFFSMMFGGLGYSFFSKPYGGHIFFFSLGLILADLIYRFRIFKGEPNAFNPKTGGQLFWIPCWLIGIIFLLLNFFVW